MPISRILAAGAATVATAASLAFVAPVVAGGKGAAVGQKYPSSQSTTHDCDNGRSITFAGPDVLWPPNHKYFEAVITAHGDGDDNVTLTSAGTHDEYADPAAHTGEQNGSGNTADDVSPFVATEDTDSSANVASVKQSIRSERSGNGDGRVYTFDVVATFDGAECRTTFTSRVPHDMRPSNRT